MSKNLWTKYTACQLEELEAVNEKYKKCLDEGKTEENVLLYQLEWLKNQGTETSKM